MFRQLHRFVAAALVVAALLTALLMRVSFVKPASAAGLAPPTISATPGTLKSGGAAGVGTPVTVTGTGFGPTQMALHVLGVIGFERSVVRLMEQGDNGHDLAGLHLGLAQALSLSRYC